ncbi:hypothetical protein BY458DRAFT_443947, partial [Sporodiniella umbellata]
DYFGLYSAKLDWSMVRCMDVCQKWIGNRDFSASDHAYLMLKVKPDEPEKVEQLQKIWQARRHQWQPNGFAPYRRTAIGTTILALVASLLVQWLLHMFRQL